MFDFTSVSPQKIIGFLILSAGLAYGAAIVIIALKNKKEVQEEKGSWLLLGLGELLVYFIATLGISDFLQNTLLIRSQKLTEDKKLPGTLVACGLMPGAVIAFSLLQVENPVSLYTLLPCVLMVVLGSRAGAKLITRLDGAKIRKVMGLALIASFLVLLVRIIILGGAAGEAVSLGFWPMLPALLISFLWGVAGMLGIPMKPTGTALFLLLGLSPLSTLTMVLVIGCMAPLSGGIHILKKRLYHQKLAVASVLTGSLGALLGSLLAISISASLLNILLLIVMAVAIFSMLKK